MENSRQRFTGVILIMIGILLILFSVPLMAQSNSESESLERKQAIKLNSLGMESYKNNDTPKALGYFQEAIKADSTFDEPYANIGEIYYKDLKRGKDAIEYYRSAIQNNPKATDYYVRLSEIYTEDGDYDAAIDNLTKAKDLAPSDPQIYYQLGDTYYNKKDYIRAEENLMALLDMQDQKFKLKAHKLLGDVYYNQQNWKKAVENYDVVISDKSAPEGLKASISKNYEKAKKNKDQGVHLIIIGVGLLLVIIPLYFFWDFIRKQKDKEAQSKYPTSATDAKDYSSLAKFAFQHIELQTGLPKGLIYFVKREAAPLKLYGCFGFEEEKFDSLEVNWEELPNWLVANQGRPFIFKIEKKEIPFMRTFGKSKDRLESADIRVGVPLMYQNEFRGIAFMSHPQMDQLQAPKFKKKFERNVDTIKKIGMEVGSAADKMYRRETSTSDSITPAFNQVYFKEKISSEVTRCKDKKHSLCLIMMEIDGIEAILKRFGEERKNYVLKTIAVEISKYLRNDVDGLYRISDYRFAIIAPNMKLDEGTKLAQKLLEEISRIKFTTPIPSVTASIGISAFPDHAADSSPLEQEARYSLDHAVSTGRNKVVIQDQVVSGSPQSPSAVSPPTPESRPTTIEPPRPTTIEPVTKPFTPKFDESVKEEKPQPFTPKYGEPASDSIPIEPPTEDGKKTGPPAFKFRSVAKSQRKSPSTRSFSPTTQSLTPTPGISAPTTVEIPDMDQEIKDSGYSTVEEMWRGDPSKREGPSMPLGVELPDTSQSKDFVPIRTDAKKMMHKKVTPPPWTKGKKKDLKEEAAAKTGEDTSVLKKPPRMRETASSTSKLPPLPTSADLKKPMIGVAKSSKSSAQVPGLRRRSSPAATSLLSAAGKSSTARGTTNLSVLKEKPVFERIRGSHAVEEIKSKTSEMKPPTDNQSDTEELKKAQQSSASKVIVPARPSPKEIKRPEMEMQKPQVQSVPPSPTPKPPAGKTVPTPPLARPPVDMGRGRKVGSNTSTLPASFDLKTIKPKIGPTAVRPGTPGPAKTPPKAISAPAKIVPSVPVARPPVQGMKKPDITPRPVPPAAKTPVTAGGPQSRMVSPVQPRQSAPTPMAPIAGAKDPITGFFQKSYFEQNIGRLMQMALQSRKPLSLLFFKLDRHKEIMQNYGENNLNNALREMSQMVSNFLKQGSDVPARYSDEIFVIILPDHSHQMSQNLAEQIRFTVNSLNFKGIPMQVTMSVGLASFPDKGKSPKELMKNAYSSLIHALKTGGNRTVVWDQSVPG